MLLRYSLLQQCHPADFRSSSVALLPPFTAAPHTSPAPAPPPSQSCTLSALPSFNPSLPFPRPSASTIRLHQLSLDFAMSSYGHARALHLTGGSGLLRGG